MNQIWITFLAGTLLRMVMVLVCLAISVFAVLRSAQLGKATAPAAFGAALLAIANVTSVATYYYQITAARAGREALLHIATVITLTTYLAQSLAVIGAALLGYAVFVGRPTPTEEL
jgi:hypothetical protein